MTQVITPQPGPQTQFLQSSADIVIYGGAASGGKSFGLCLEALRYVSNPHHRAVIFRRTSPMLRAPGSIYNTAKSLYLPLGAKLNDTRMTFAFPSGATISFSHMQTEEHAKAWQGTELSFVGFDEVTHFLESQVVYILSRLRNESIHPYARITCNPDSSSFVKSWVEPFLDGNKQFPELTKARKIKYIGFSEGTEGGITFSDTKDDVHTLSFTFIPASVEDNKILLTRDPTYKDKLKALSFVERQQLLYGDWSVSYSKGNIFRREWFKPLTPQQVTGKFVLAFDLASTVPSSTNRDPDFSAACLLQRNGHNIIVHRTWRVRKTGGDVYTWMLNVCREAKQIAGMNLMRAFTEIEPGSASKRELETIQKQLREVVDIQGVTSTKSKVIRARSASAAAERGNIYYIPGIWSESFLQELEEFPEGNKDDQVDSFTLAYNEIQKTSLVG